MTTLNAQSDSSLGSILSQTWDVAVIGAGLGGATLGYDLARRGHSVLFLERGPVQASAEQSQSNGNNGSVPHDGWWPADLAHHDGASVHSFRHPMGCGTGGSSAMFGMVMERFRPEDFQPGRYFPNAGASTVPDAWPISYTDLEPYYNKAERLYRVRGEPDPLFPDGESCLPPPPATDKERQLLNALSESGLHPYRFHYACERVPGCDGCVGKLCPNNCRNDSHRICIIPAVEKHGASLLTDCRVERLECSNRTVTEIVGQQGDRSVRIKARVVVLAANTFGSPLILFRSRNNQFPNGLANGSDMVGRNLMLHVSDSLLVKRKGGAIWRMKPAGSPMNHGIGVNDFYQIDGVKHGNIHAHPISVSPESVKAYLRQTFARKSRQFPRVVNVVSWIGATLQAEQTYFATIVDDLPYAENRVLPEPSTDDRMAYVYTIHDELRTRANNLVRKFSDAVRKRCSVTVMTHSHLNRGHSCGTLRFGHDPRTSVLDSTNRAHEVDNLYAVDASFFPSSGGINPGLTIAANALRVAEVIAGRL